MSFSLSPTVVEIGFNPTVYSVNEDSVFVVLNVENRNPNMERDVHVHISTIVGTANSELRTRFYVYIRIIVYLLTFFWQHLIFNLKIEP